jgi:hypothetical protein
MFRIVDKPKHLFALSWAVSITSGVAIVFFGAPVATLFIAGCALLGFYSLAEHYNGRERRRKR